MAAGIDFDKELQTREEILRQLEACRKGEITPEELNSAKEAIRSGIRAAHDSPGAIEGYYSTTALSEVKLTAESYLDAVEQATVEEVAAAARTLTLRASYFLRGEA